MAMTVMGNKESVHLTISYASNNIAHTGTLKKKDIVLKNWMTVDVSDDDLEALASLISEGSTKKTYGLKGVPSKVRGKEEVDPEKKKEFLKKLLTKTVKMMQYKLTVGEWENDEQFGFAAQSWDQVLEMTDDKKGSHIASEMKAILHCFEEQFKLTNFPNLDVSVNALLKGISPDPSERVNVSVYKRTRRTEKFLGSNGRQREKVVVMPWKGIETLLPISQLDILRGGNQDIMKDLYSQSVSSAQLILRQSVVLMDTPVKEEEE